MDFFLDSSCNIGLSNESVEYIFDQNSLATNISNNSNNTVESDQNSNKQDFMTFLVFLVCFIRSKNNQRNAMQRRKSLQVTFSTFARINSAEAPVNEVESSVYRKGEKSIIAK
ncbi:hypothetical protein HK099_002459 [Clydaea vesicula]|uniref:Uncharacterized protein n=1 Tax=Clydaea vesicula TaxID=447962 RepID=A0AAD5U5L1_9FUNG|nr:hypothetical protein HK099_002459 [Clydaea vesicula]KAJ3397719.1 hypothetical protein HDU92_004135 [Lobulomyces angularis]